VILAEFPTLGKLGKVVRGNVVNAKSLQMFDEGFRRYQAGEAAAEVIPLFVQLGQQDPEEQSVWVCLSWLQLLANLPEDAAKSARKAVFLDRDSAQAHINLVLALTDSKQQGALYHLEQAKNILAKDPSQKDDVLENFAEALRRRPDWSTVSRIQEKLFETTV